MTGAEMERAIEFLIEHQAKVGTNMDMLSADIAGLKEAQQRTSANIDSLTETVVGLAESVSRLQAQAEGDRQETRETINNLILANEVTRRLAEDVARLAVATSQRVASLEDKLR